MPAMTRPRQPSPKETGIPTTSGTFRIRFLRRRIAKVEAELGPIDVLVNNAGITKDGMFHKMTKDTVVWGHQHQPQLAGST